MAKKLFIILMVLCLIFSLASCGGDTPKNEGAGNVLLDDEQTQTGDEDQPQTDDKTDEKNTESHSHSYSKATCQAPATCSCGATTGGKGNHNYSNGVCTVCGAKNYLNPTSNLKTNTEYIGNLHVSGDMLIGGALQFESDACVVTERYFNSVQTDPNQSPIIFKGTKYYSEGGGQEPHYYELTDSEVIVKGSFWGGSADAVTIKLVLQGNGLLKVTQSNNSLFPAGALFSTNINDVLK